MYSYTPKMRYDAIMFRTEEPAFSALPDYPNMWDQNIYGNVREEIPRDIPKLLGKFVVTMITKMLTYSMTSCQDGTV